MLCKRDTFKISASMYDLYCAPLGLAVNPDCRPLAGYFQESDTVNSSGLQYKQKTEGSGRGWKMEAVQGAEICHMKNSILSVKRALEKTPESILFGNIKEGNPLICERGIYYDFLRAADGLRAGAIDLWGYKALLRNQYMVQDKEKWICIGQIIYIPLLLKRESNEVYRYDEMAEEEERWILISGFYEFMMEYVFGDKYAMIVPGGIGDKWYGFMKSLTDGKRFDIWERRERICQ